MGYFVLASKIQLKKVISFKGIVLSSFIFIQEYDLVKHVSYAPFFNKQSIFDPCPENYLGFSKKLPRKIV